MEMQIKFMGEKKKKESEVARHKHKHQAATRTMAKRLFLFDGTLTYVTKCETIESLEAEWEAATLTKVDKGKNLWLKLASAAGWGLVARRRFDVLEGGDTVYFGGKFKNPSPR